MGSCAPVFVGPICSTYSCYMVATPLPGTCLVRVLRQCTRNASDTIGDRRSDARRRNISVTNLLWVNWKLIQVKLMLSPNSDVRLFQHDSLVRCVQWGWNILSLELFFVMQKPATYRPTQGPKTHSIASAKVSRLVRMYSKKDRCLLRQPKGTLIHTHTHTLTYTHIHTHTLCGWKEESLDATR